MNISHSSGLSGRIRVLLTGPDGEVITDVTRPNVITRPGDTMYAARGAGVASPPAVPTGMKLGTGTTTPAKTGAGAALGSYLADSHQPLDATPTHALVGGLREVTYVATWGTGKATTASAITEVVLVNHALTDATSGAAATIARAAVTGVPSKGVGDTLQISWTHTLGTL